jgi:hypothetical protein
MKQTQKKEHEADLEMLKKAIGTENDKKSLWN